MVVQLICIDDIVPEEFPPAKAIALSSTGVEAVIGLRTNEKRYEKEELSVRSQVLQRLYEVVLE